MEFFSKQKIIFERWGYFEYQKNIEKIKNMRKSYKYFPYLYAYDESEENLYQKSYLMAGNRLDAFVAIYNNNLVGISIGCPLLQVVAICADLIDTPLNMGSTYYFGDIIVEKNYWGQGIAKELYSRHICHARNMNFYNILALMVERCDNDLRKPVKYKKSQLWSSFQFLFTDYTTTYPWNTFSLSGAITRENHVMRAYQKLLLPIFEAEKI